MKKLDRRRSFNVSTRNILGRTVYSLKDLRWKTLKYIRAQNAPGELKLKFSFDKQEVICSHIFPFRSKVCSSSFIDEEKGKLLSLISLAKTKGVERSYHVWSLHKENSGTHFFIKSKFYGRSRTYMGLRLYGRR